ncbi:hypothetical protein TVAG_108260 [Trichomonas vaginalis G3]|uniref:Uncharacterized protein n=1 Tax=Trichomonas vaginalis (strain ATCC PRA-98 / G3) TaxID=412133 RepID=A2EQF0_TRIV3|nr:pectin lyase-like family [Trichomonas vaginalis G3]EAY05092.1 hypothetical protein TVAG_108260 [Trichomonas vaginalis G3]KAI5551478.1 pectin lyase-like family [Trichomonas vaginalis G3]|eukprot:XP_001317315.1 hypothetical protein [Trichomonas vaginalis G3]
MINVTLLHLSLVKFDRSPIFSSIVNLKVQHSSFSRFFSPIFYSIRPLRVEKSSFRNSLSPVYLSNDDTRKYYTGTQEQAVEVNSDATEVIFDNCIFQGANTYVISNNNNAVLRVMCSTFNSLSATSTQMNALIYSAQAIIYHCYIKNTVEIPIISSYSIQLVSNNIASSKGSLTSPNSNYFKINIMYNNITSSQISLISTTDSSFASETGISFSYNTLQGGSQTQFCTLDPKFSFSYSNFVQNSMSIFELKQNSVISNCVFIGNNGKIATSAESPFGYQYTLKLVNCLTDKSISDCGAVTGDSSQFEQSSISRILFNYADEDPKCPTLPPTPGPSPVPTVSQSPTRSPLPSTPPQTDNLPERTPYPERTPEETPAQSPYPSQSPPPTNSPKATVNSIGIIIVVVPVLLFIIIIPILVLVIIRLVREMSSNEAAKKNDYQRFFSDEGSSSSDRPDPLELRMSSSGNDGDDDVFAMSLEERGKYMPKKTSSQTKDEIIYDFMNA